MNKMKRGLALFVTIIICNHTFIFAQVKHDQERSVFDYCNALRTNPKHFLKEVVMPYLEENEINETNTYVTSLIKDLKNKNHCLPWYGTNTFTNNRMSSPWTWEKLVQQVIIQRNWDELKNG